MDETLPNEFDLIVVGTGFSESVVAAAASRNGKTVLHLDPNEFYGGVWASFNLEALQKFIDSCQNHVVDTNEKPTIKENCCEIQGAKQKWHIDVAEPKSEENPVEGEVEWTKEKVLKEFRKFNIDLSPKLLFANGTLVNLLITSNICRYAEFRAVDRICTLMNDQVKNVPCSRADVFNTKDVQIIEKRLLMKLLTTCMTYNENTEEFADFQDKTFLEYLKSNKLTDNIIHYVLYAISMSNEQTPMNVGMERTKKFLSSLGRYGNTPFLFPMYGCGEIPQCFCRLCAVFGGIYCLKRPIEKIKLTEESGEKVLHAIVCGDQEIKAKQLVIGSGNVPKGLLKEDSIGSEVEKSCGRLARGIFVTSTPLGDEEMNSGGGGVNLLKLPAEGQSSGAILIQLSHYSGCSPKGLYIIHITCDATTNDAEAALKPYVDQIFKADDTNSPKIFYSAYFAIPKCGKCAASNPESLPKNVHFTCGPFLELDYDLSIENARDVFNKIYPDETFLPRAPDPDEIIIGDEDPVAVQGEEAHEVSIEEQIKELQEGIENHAKCMEDNSMNEEKDGTPTEE